MEEFIIPLLREELTKRISSNQYHVSKLVSVSSLSKHIAVCEQEFLDRGHLFVQNMFDYLYSVLYFWHEVDNKLKEKIWDILLKSCKKTTPSVLEIINDTNISRDEQTIYRNSIKMNVYLLCQILELYINDIHQANQFNDKTPKGGKKKKNTASQIDIMEEIEISLHAINQLFQCKINKFWEPPIVEEDFINLVTNICYKLLENQEFCKNTAIRENLTKTLINMIKHYGHNLSCPVKLVQLLHRYSHMSIHLIYICRSLLTIENLTNVVRDILSEICAYSSLDLERDNQASSSFSSFLIEFSSEFPNHIISLLPQLKNKLDEDPYSMRNCVLSIFGEVVIQIYSKDPDNNQNQDSLIELIEDHVCDVNGFVRAKALGILLTIIEKCTLPLSRLAKILNLIVGVDGAMYDTSSIARKNAIRIITCIVDLNLSKGLSFQDLKERQEEEKQALEKLNKQISEMPDEIADMERQIDFLQGKIANDKNYTTESVPFESKQVAKEGLEKKISELKGVIFILGQMMEITFHIESSLNDIQCMLSSKVSSDVMEAISFFVKAKKSNLINVDIGIRKMLPHVCSKEDSIKAAITNAYKILYLEVEDDDNDRCQSIVNSLTNLVVNPTFGELICIEKLIVNFTECGDLDQQVINCLWNRFRCNTDQFTTLQRKCALILLSMVANVNNPFMSKYFICLLNEGIPLIGIETLDLQMVEYICVTLQNYVKSQSRKKNKLDEVYRLPRTHTLFDRLFNLMVKTFSLKNKLNWIPMSNEIINTIYLLSENPNIICSKMITIFAKEIFLAYESYCEIQNEDKLLCQDFMLTRFVSVGGHLAMKHFIYFDSDILTELKRRNTIKEEKDQAKKSLKLAKDKRRQTMTNGKNGETNLDEEIGLVGATADDAEAEFIRKLCESELITNPTKLLNRLLNLVVYICSNVSRFKDKDLQKISTLSLGKMMLISSRVCMDNIDLLFTLAARSPSEIIRANLIVALGDLIKRFTTKLEPYTPSLYGRLRDSSPMVRLNALNVLSHLILNDMIKVKGQISEMTTCIIDINPRIVHLSKIFFQELANKDKALYNVMPDIISRLSNPQTGVKEDEFRIIMEYLMPFIQKKNQSENLFEKICARFHSAHDERSWRDLSFCLSLMPFSEAMLRALQFNLNSFGGKLHVEEVYDAINGILINAKKNVKGEIIAVIEEMSTLLLKLREQGVEDEEANLSAQRAALKKTIKLKKHRETAASQKDRISKPFPTDIDQSIVGLSKSQMSVRKTKKNPGKASSEDDFIDDNESIASRKPKRATRKPTEVQRLHIFSDSEEEDDDFEKEEKSKSFSKTSRKRNKIVEDSSQSEDSD